MNDSGIQSALEAARGSSAASINELSTVLHIGGAVILAIVLGLVLRAVLAGPKNIDVRRWVIGGGLIFPVVTLLALFVYAFAVGHSLETDSADDAVRIHVVGRQWWWEVRYAADPDGDFDVVLANEIHLPVGRPAHIELTSGDVIHSFWVPALAGKVDMIPGYRNQLVVRSDQPGIFRGQCAEYCGAQHALMALHVVAEPEEQFKAWLARQARPAVVPGDPELRRGHDQFFAGGCAACHTIRGTEANGRLGPDLTHVGSRHSLAAGTLRNHSGTMAGWIAGPQDLKAGSLMPDARSYSGPELRALSTWLESLK